MLQLLAALDRQIDLNALIWTFPAAFLLHDAEEILTMERFARTHGKRLPRLLRSLATITTAQFTTAVAILFALTLLAAFLATRTPRDVTLFTITVTIFFLHVFTHVVQPLHFRAYTPGLVTAFLVVLPYSLYALHRLFADGLLREHDFNMALLIGALVTVPFIVGLRQLGKLLAR